MRHKKSGNRLSRETSHRRSMLLNLCKSLIEHERITTTHAKALEARKLIDKLITLGKKNTLAAKRIAFSVLIDHDLVSHLFNKIAPRFQARQGGYTRLIKYAINRQGDNARMTLLELTEREIKAEAPSSDKVVDAQIVEGKSGKAGKPEKAAKVPKAAKVIKATKGAASAPEKKTASKKPASKSS